MTRINLINTLMPKIIKMDIPSIFYLCDVKVLLNRWLRANAKMERLTVSCRSSQAEHKQDLHTKVRTVNVVKMGAVFWLKPKIRRVVNSPTSVD